MANRERTLQALIRSLAIDSCAKGVPMGLWPTKADGNPLANARGSAWDAHCKQSRDRERAIDSCAKGADFRRHTGSDEIP